MARTASLVHRGQRPSMVVIVTLLLVAVPVLTAAASLYRVDLIVLYVIAGMGLNVSLGFGGEQLMGQALVAGVASYATALLSLNHGWSAAETAPAAVCAAAIAQIVISLPGLKVQGLYLGLVSFFGVIVFQSLVDLFHFTGGNNGLYGIQPLISSSTGGVAAEEVYEVLLGLGFLVLVCIRLVLRSSWGLRIRALRDAPAALVTTGIGISRTKIAVYLITAVPTGIAGWGLAYLDQSVVPSVFSVTFTLVLFAGVQLLAPGTLLGGIVGVSVLEGYSQLVGPFSQYNVLGLGILIVVVITLRHSAVLESRWARRVVEVVPLRTLASRISANTTERVQTKGRPIGPDSASSVDGAAPQSPRSNAVGDRAVVHELSGPVLEVRSVTKQFGGVEAVCEATFTLQPGRVVALIGENGSGKTTLVNMVSGLVRPSAGQILIRQRNIKGLSAPQVARLGCSRTFQLPHVVLDASVSENVELGFLASYGSSIATAVLMPWRARRMTASRRSLSDRLCADVGITRIEARSRIGQLPLGVRRLAEVARAIASNAPLICLDEPAVGLETTELQHLSALLRDLAARGHAVLVVAHDARFVMDTCDDVLLMRRGRIVGDYRDVRPDALPSELSEYFRHMPSLSLTLRPTEPTRLGPAL